MRTALGNTWDDGSNFDPTFKSPLERIAFLQLLGDRMTQPVMPDDEAFDYLPTQAIADFLATQNKPQFDGIIFRSVQVKGGRNVVLFHKAARVETMKLPQGTEIEAHSGYGTEDGCIRSVNEYHLYRRPQTMMMAGISSHNFRARFTIPMKPISGM